MEFSKMPEGVINVYLWWGWGYCLPISGSCTCIAYESSSFVELPPAPVSLSAFCIFPKYAPYHWKVLTLLVPGECLVPTTGLGLAHGEVAGWVIKWVLVGWELVCHRWGLSLLREPRSGWWGWMRAVGHPIKGCVQWSGKGCVGADNFCLSPV